MKMTNIQYVNDKVKRVILRLKLKYLGTFHIQWIKTLRIYTANKTTASDVKLAYPKVVHQFFNCQRQ